MQAVTGTWQLINTECIAEDGSVLEPPYGGADSCMGLLSLGDDGRMISVLYNSQEKLPANQTREYNSYCGAYHFDGKQLVTRVDACSNSSFMGTEQIRDVMFENDVMVLKPIKNNGPLSDGQRILYWVRLPDIDNN